MSQQHQKTILANGLTIVSYTNEDVSSIAIEVLVKIGSRYERANLNGIAHFIEHMNFKGTNKRSAKEIAEEFDAIGGYLNAYTSKEHTVYTAKILKEFLPITIEILADIMFHSRYDHEEIEKEKNVVLHELAQTQDSPDELVFDYFSEQAYQKQALGRSILGKQETILNFDQAAIIQFVQQHYIAPKIIIAAAGKVDHQELVDLISEKFIPFKSQIIEAENALYVGGSHFEHNPELAQLHMVVGYEGFAVNSPEYYQLEILANILGGSISSRLFQEIREKRGLAYSIGSFTTYYQDCGMFGIFLGTVGDKAVELLDVLSQEVLKISHNITQEEMNRSLAQVRSSLLMSRETTDNWVSILAGNYACYGRYIPSEEILAGYMNVTRTDLCEIAERIFSGKKQITIAALGDVSHLADYQHIQKILSI